MPLNIREHLVYTQWINHSEGPIYGRVFTVDQQAGALLISLLSLFTKTALSSLFGILRFLVFYFRSSPDPKYGYHHQFQAILRNQHTPFGTAMDSTSMYETWRKHGRGAKAKAFRMTTFALSMAAGILVASLLASRTSRTPPVVLLQEDPSQCGIWSAQMNVWNENGTASNSTQDIDGANSLVIWQEIGNKALDMARVCYSGDNLTNDPSCVTYGTNLIDFASYNVSACPLGPRACDNSTSPITFTSEYIDSLDHLGINTYKGDNVYLKVNATCAPIDVSDSVYFYYPPANGTPSDFTLARDYYGGNQSTQVVLELGRMSSGLWTDDELQNNETSVFDFWTHKGAITPIISYTRGGRNDYSLDPNQLYAQNSTWVDEYGTFRPRPDLPWDYANGDVDILVLANVATYPQPVSDPWFRAETPTNTTPPRYYSDQTARAVACTHTRYICPGKDAGNCLPIMMDLSTDSLNAFLDNATEFTENQKLLLPRVMRATYSASFYSQALWMGSPGLLASRSIFEGFAQPLPDDQWVQELQSMFASMLVGIQIASSEMVRNSLNLGFPKDPFPANQTFMCGAQMILNGSETSFSILGVTIIVVLGAFFILYEKFQPHIIAFLPPHTPLKEYRIKEWYFQNFYQLQRVAYESNNAGQWEGESKVPTSLIQSAFPTPLHAFSTNIPRHESFGGVQHDEKGHVGSDTGSNEYPPRPPQTHGGAFQAYKQANASSHAIYDGPRQ